MQEMLGELGSLVFLVTAQQAEFRLSQATAS